VYERELKIAKRSHDYITFMMLDIDFFKQYNDTYGHIMGDFALQKVANVLKKCFKRPGDFVFRLGGEEFGVLILDTDELNSARLAKDLCKMVKEEKIEHKASKVANIVTVSVGVMSCIADETLDSEELIKTADEMLYKAKETGRDRYMITSEVIH
jgi:diguanylate cyclase (GGDEF)-like protein